MRRKYLAIITIPYILPLAEALSLANFQEITSILIPISCQLQYDSQIPTCTVSDFENGCSISCQSALNSMAARVSNACSDVSVNSNTLLGIVMNGGVVEALCPAETKTTTTLAKSSPTPIAVSTTAPQATAAPAPVSSVTLPTESPGVTGGDGLSSKTSTTSEPIAQSAVSTSSSRSVPGKTTSSKTTATTAAVSSTTLQPAQGGLGGGTTSSSTSKKNAATTTAASQSSQKAQPANDGSGGGSPFDISSSGSRSATSSTFGVLVMATWIGVLLGR